jgi:GntR family transcriptional regulator/MocR family aminotransferase
MKLPSSRKLAQQLNVARNTVVAAYQQLIADGYLVSRQRSGIRDLRDGSSDLSGISG